MAAIFLVVASLLCFVVVVVVVFLISAGLVTLCVHIFFFISMLFAVLQQLFVSTLFSFLASYRTRVLFIHCLFRCKLKKIQAALVDFKRDFLPIVM